MLYIVEMDFRHADREHDWHAWYLEHTTHLVRNVPGFSGTQRFRCLTSSVSPWLALHEVSGPEMFESPQYKSGGGPASTGEWAKLHTNWHRNLFDGTARSPNVPMDCHLLMSEGRAALPAGLAGAKIELSCVGLDRSSPWRTVVPVPAGQLTAGLFALDGVRIYKPITPKISR